MWTDSLIVNFLVNLLLNLVAGFIIFVVGLRWRLITSYLTRDRAAFRRVFGRAAHEAGLITITLDTYRDVRFLSEQVRKTIGVKPTQPPPEGLSLPCYIIIIMVHTLRTTFSTHHDAFSVPYGSFISVLG
jgi:hypothetical protein